MFSRAKRGLQTITSKSKDASSQEKKVAKNVTTSLAISLQELSVNFRKSQSSYLKRESSATAVLMLAVSIVSESIHHYKKNSVSNSERLHKYMYCIVEIFHGNTCFWNDELRRTRASSWNVGQICSYQVKLSKQRAFHHFMSTGAIEKYLHSILFVVSLYNVPVQFLQWECWDFSVVWNDEGLLPDNFTWYM